MTLHEAKKILTRQLRQQNDQDEATAMTSLVLEKVTGIPINRLALQKDSILSAEQLAMLEYYKKELAKGKPVQYVLGEAWFLNRKFTVNESVLIPRPETEELVLRAVEHIKQYPNKKWKILDVGTGSGCIAISLSLLLPDAAITAIDISNEALQTAGQNAENLQANVRFLELDFLNEVNWKNLGKFDIIISNPPYISQNEKGILSANVVDWEPSLALFSPDTDPLIFFNKLAAFGKDHLTEKGIIFAEGHQERMDEASNCFVQSGYQTEIRPDIHGNPRMLAAWQ